MRNLTVSIGAGSRLVDNALIKKTWIGSWPLFVQSILSDVKETEDKTSNGWVCGAEFSEPYRKSDNFVGRHLLSLDYDAITKEDLEDLLAKVRGFAHLAYTTASSTAEDPRLRIWAPLSRPCSDDEFSAVARRFADTVLGGVGRAASESYRAAQYMYRPTVKPFSEFEHWENLEGPWVDVDKILGEYDDWTDWKKWPGYEEGSGARSDSRTKPGLIGAFNRAFTVPAAIERFGLPYSDAGSGRYLYTLGSGKPGARLYDEETKLHSEHNTDPARGQHNAYDLVRIHEFGWLDGPDAENISLSRRASSLAMAERAGAIKEVRDELCSAEFEPIDDLDLVVEKRNAPAIPAGAWITRREVLKLPDPVWLIEKLIPQAQLGMLYGPTSVGKSFVALDMAESIASGAAWHGRAVRQGAVGYIIAEYSGDFKLRLQAREKVYGDPGELIKYYVGAPLLVQEKTRKKLIDEILAMRQDWKLIVVDTVSRTYLGSESDDKDMNSYVRACQAIHFATGAMVLLVHHSGKDLTKGARGHTALAAAADVEIEVTRGQMTVTKQRGGKDNEVLPFILKIQDLENGFDSCTIELTRVDPARQVDLVHFEGLASST